MNRAEGIVASGATLWVEGSSSKSWTRALEAAGMLGVVWSTSAVQAREELKQAAPDLWLLAGLPDPLPRLRVIRRKAPQVLVHVLVADTDLVSEAAVLDAGADGFSIADTDPRTLLARLKCLLRRAAL